MARKHSTTRDGSNFSDQAIEAVWSKATVVPDYDSRVYRKDRCGAWIQRSAYGDVDNEWGWEVDHDKPVALGGSDDLANLQPLHWKNNRYKADNWPSWSCKISSK
jgi:hypothetical protein